jgi:hypothetical protein
VSVGDYAAAAIDQRSRRCYRCSDASASRAPGGRPDERAADDCPDDGPGDGPDDCADRAPGRASRVRG